jgi:hypothetical protein
MSGRANSNAGEDRYPSGSATNRSGNSVASTVRVIA